MNPRGSFPPYALSRGASSPLEYFSMITIRYNIKWRRGWDSNPRSLARSLVFKTSSLNHSDTSPMAFTNIIIILQCWQKVKRFLPNHQYIQFFYYAFALIIYLIKTSVLFSSSLLITIFKSIFNVLPISFPSNPISRRSAPFIARSCSL